MSARRPKVVEKVLGDTDVVGLFNDVLGTDSHGPSRLAIIVPKMMDMQAQSDRFCRMLTLLGDDRWFAAQPSAAVLAAYRTEVLAAAEEAFGNVAVKAVIDVAPEYQGVDEATSIEFDRLYCATKTKSSLVAKMLGTYVRLGRVKQCITNDEALDGSFLAHASIVRFEPLHGCDIDFRALYLGAPAEEKHMLLLFMHKMLDITGKMHAAVTSPDVNIDEFIGVVTQSINQVRGQIRDCDDAFDKLIDATGLLRNKFGGYYHSAMASGNNSVIMENFITDVAMQTDASAKVQSQFKKIIMMYRKLAQKNQSDPRVNSLFKHVDSNFAALDGSAGDEETAQKMESASVAVDAAGEAADAVAAMYVADRPDDAAHSVLAMRSGVPVRGGVPVAATVATTTTTTTTATAAATTTTAAAADGAAAQPNRRTAKRNAARRAAAKRQATPD